MSAEGEKNQLIKPGETPAVSEKTETVSEVGSRPGVCSLARREPLSGLYSSTEQELCYATKVLFTPGPGGPGYYKV